MTKFEISSMNNTKCGAPSVDAVSIGRPTSFYTRFRRRACSESAFPDFCPICSIKYIRRTLGPPLSKSCGTPRTTPVFEHLHNPHLVTMGKSLMPGRREGNEGHSWKSICALFTNFIRRTLYGTSYSRILPFCDNTSFASKGSGKHLQAHCAF